MAERGKGYLTEKVCSLLESEKRGKLLDVGTGGGDLAKEANDLGFSVTACDLDRAKFKFHSEIDFKQLDLNEPLPFEDGVFDYIVCLEVIEHLENPQSVVREFHRILKENGIVLLSTPNILNLKSRLRFLFEGSYEYFREPPLEQFKDLTIDNLGIHVTPLRLHELEYILFKNGFSVEEVTTSLPKARFLFPLKFPIGMQMFFKRMRAKRKGDIDYTRIHNLLLSKELLYGRHLIVKARKS